MTETMGVTSVPLPAFWFLSKNEGDQSRRSSRKEHLCQNPRCAANMMAYSTPHPEPPMKRIKRSFKNVKPNNVCPVSSNGTPRGSETCGGISAQARHAGKYADSNVASSPTPMETCGGLKAHSRFSGKYAESNVASSPRPAKPRRESCEVRPRYESTGINPRESTTSAGHASTRLTGIFLEESTISGRLNSNEFEISIGIDSTESTTSISSTSHAPSVSTPRRSPPKPSKFFVSPLSVQKEITSTGSSSPGCSQGTTQSLPTCRRSESMDRSLADGNRTPSFLMSGRIAPPNSEIDEEEAPPIDRLIPSLTRPQFHGLPVGSSSTPRRPPSLPPSRDPITRPKIPAPPKFSPNSINCLPAGSSSISNWPPTSPTEVDPVPRAVNAGSENASPPSNLPAAPLSSFAATIPTEATTNGILATPMSCSVSPKINKLSEGRSGYGSCHAPSLIEHVKSRRSTALPKSRESISSTRSSTFATMSNAAQMCILKQRLEDEDHLSDSSSLNTAGSDSPVESCSIEPSTSLCGAKPVSAFYNALYAPDCTLGGTKALEAHLDWQNHSADRKFRVALEIAMLSAMVTILVVVFYPAITRGLRSHFYGCCSCPAATAASRNPSQHYQQLKSPHWRAGRGRNVWNCPLEKHTRGSTVVK